MDEQTPTQIGREGLTQKHGHTQITGAHIIDIWMSLDTHTDGWTDTHTNWERGIDTKT